MPRSRPIQATKLESQCEGIHRGLKRDTAVVRAAHKSKQQAIPDGSTNAAANYTRLSAVPV